MLLMLVKWGQLNLPIVAGNPGWRQKDIRAGEAVMEKWLSDGLAALGGVIVFGFGLAVVFWLLRRVLPWLGRLLLWIVSLAVSVLLLTWYGLRMLAWPAVFMLGGAAVAAFLGRLAGGEVLYTWAPAGALLGFVAYLTVWARGRN